MVGLIIRVDLIQAVALAHRALRTVSICRGQSGAHVFKPDLVLEQRRRVELYSHRRERTAVDRYLPDALDPRQRLLHYGRCRIVDLPARQRIRGHRQDSDRRGGRVDLAVGWILTQVGRQVGARRIDRRLNVACSTVYVAIEAELQRDAALTNRILGGHFAHIGNDPKMAFQRCRHTRCHYVGACARHRRKHRDRREIDLWQRRDWQLEISKKSRKNDAKGE